LPVWLVELSLKRPVNWRETLLPNVTQLHSTQPCYTAANPFAAALAASRMVWPYNTEANLFDAFIETAKVVAKNQDFP